MAHQSDDLKAEILRATDIVDLVGEHVKLKRSGRNFVGLCPFHNEKTPSFNVNPERQMFKCFGCGEGGDVFSFVMKREGLGFVEAMRHLAERAGIDTAGRIGGNRDADQQKAQLLRVNEWASKVFRSQLAHDALGAACRGYLERRGISAAMVERFDLGCALDSWDALLRRAAQSEVSEDLLLTAGLVARSQRTQNLFDYFRNRLMFPIRGTNGKVIGFGGRTLGDDRAKYLNSPETPAFSKGRNLYGAFEAHKAILEKRQAIVVEGYTDAIMAHQQGVENVVAVLGTALTRDHIHLLRRYADEVVLIFDGDEAGQRSADRSLDLFVEEEMKVRLATMPEGKDPFDFLVEQGGPAFEAVVANAQDLFDFKLHYLRGQYDADTLDGKTEIARELVATAVRCPDMVKQDLIIQRIASELHVTENAVRAAAERARPRQQYDRPQPEAPPEEAASAPLRPRRMDAAMRAQRILVNAMVEDADWVPQVQEQLGEAGFTDDRLRSLASGIFKAFQAEAVVDPLLLLEQIAEPDLRELLADISAQEGSRTPSPDEVTGCLDYLVHEHQARLTEMAMRARHEQALSAGDERAAFEALQRRQDQERERENRRKKRPRLFDGPQNQ